MNTRLVQGGFHKFYKLMILKTSFEPPLMNFLKTFYEFLKNFYEFLKTSYEVPTITFKMSYKFLTHFLQKYHKPRHMNFTYKFTMKM